MGSFISKQQYVRLEAKSLDETVFGCYTEVSSATRNADVVSVTDEAFGNAANLLNVEIPELFDDSQDEESRDGWIVKRHQAEASVTIRLCNTSHIIGLDIDTTGFNNTCPTHALVEGYQVTNEDTNEMWTTLIKDEPINENSHNFFQIEKDETLYSLVRLTVSPGGGIARFRIYGDIVPDWSDVTKEYNLASANDGARIVRWSDTGNANKPNILMDNGTLTTHGWLNPRSKQNDRNDFIVIQLSSPGTLNSAVVDTTGFIGNAPLTIQIDGCNSPEEDPYNDIYTQWIPLVSNSPVRENCLNTFQLHGDKVVSHVRLAVFPDGGIQQIKCFGFINHEKNLELTSIKLLEDSNTPEDTYSDSRNSSQPTSITSEGSLTAFSEEMDGYQPAIKQLGICNNMPLSPPAVVDNSIPIVDHDLYEKIIIEELNGSTTQLLIPTTETECYDEITTNDEMEVEASEIPLVDQLNLMHVPLSPVYTQSTENTMVTETTVIDVEAIDVTDRKRKSPEAQVELPVKKKRSRTPTRVLEPRRSRSRPVEVKEEETVIELPKRKGRGRSKKN